MINIKYMNIYIIEYEYQYVYRAKPRKTGNTQYEYNTWNVQSCPVADPKTKIKYAQMDMIDI